MDRRSILRKSLALASVLPWSGMVGAREPVIGGPCQGCEFVFDDLPENLAALARIAPAGEPGAPMVIEGVVTTAGGAVARDVIVYAYHTDAQGIYPPGRNAHGRLRGWARTDAQGRYRFDTIRPGHYPGRDVAEHVHMHVIEPGVGTYYLENLEFEDDPLQSGRAGHQRGGRGLMRPSRRNGVWHARRDIVLGRNIPDYRPR